MPRLFQPMVLCAKSEAGSKQGTCQGDSGGPLMIFNSNQEVVFQVGIVSGGLTLDQCGVKNYPSVFASVNHPKNLEFIMKTVKIPGEPKFIL